MKMRMLRDKLRRIKCWITGGHVYNPLDRAVKYVRYRDEFVIWGECTKCGKVYRDKIPAEWFRRATDHRSENAKTINFSTYIDAFKFDINKSYAADPLKEEQHESERVPQGN